MSWHNDTSGKVERLLKQFFVTGNAGRGDELLCEFLLVRRGDGGEGMSLLGLASDFLLVLHDAECQKSDAISAISAQKPKRRVNPMQG